MQEQINIVLYVCFSIKTQSDCLCAMMCSENDLFLPLFLSFQLQKSMLILTQIHSGLKKKKEAYLAFSEDIFVLHISFLYQEDFTVATDVPL